ncbi:MAG: hypothetical protein ABL963_16785, partial [Longimicrobiales bacterium]
GAVALFPVALEACASAGRPGGVETPSMVSYTGTGGRGAMTLTAEAGVGETTLAESPTAVWAVLPAVFRVLGVEATVTDRASGQMGNPGFRPRRIENRRLSLFLDCGSGLTGDYADVYQVDMMLRVEVVSTSPESTTVRTTVDAYAQDRNTSGNPIHCRSRGSLERRVGELVAARLAA